MSAIKRSLKPGISNNVGYQDDISKALAIVTSRDAKTSIRSATGPKINIYSITRGPGKHKPKMSVKEWSFIFPLLESYDVRPDEVYVTAALGESNVATYVFRQTESGLEYMKRFKHCNGKKSAAY